MKNMFKREFGVTLIALIITIIVLLILAGVAFNTLLGSNGLLNRASDAAEKSREAANNEEIALKELEDELGKWANGGFLEPPVGWQEYVDKVTSDGVPIPKGFTYVTGTKNTGTVIKDGDNNEFVWVPVEDLEDDGTRNGEFNDDFQFGRRLFGRSDPLGTISNMSDYTETLPGALTDSVDKYGGFYIARYQASYEDGKVASKVSTTATTDAWANTNGRLWNWITQLTAITKCSEMYGSSASVVPHLPYGAEWDTTLQWLKQTVFSGNNTIIGTDSKDWGNYVGADFIGAGELQNTGVTAYTKRNNIYDLAGNLIEFTQEVKYAGGSGCGARGGRFDGVGAGTAAGVRDAIPSSTTAPQWGFRAAFYIK